MYILSEVGHPGLELAHKRKPNMTAVGDEANCGTQSGIVAVER
jgi:hypothetical protein